MVSNQPSGLRFDIYERVHLPENLEAIRELEEIELVPQIQVITQDEQAVLQGHLLLTGKYTGEDEARGVQELEYYIPVEITLPRSRVQSEDSIGVEIESFDVDVLSSRSLNVTGVLSLQGFDFSSASGNEQWEAEEPVFIHESGAQPEHRNEEQQGRTNDTLEPSESYGREGSLFDQEAAEAAAPAYEADGDAVGAGDAAESEAAEAVEAVSLSFDSEEEPQAAVLEKKEMKIAFSSHSQESGFAANGGISDVLHRSEGSAANAAATAEAAAVAEAKAEESKSATAAPEASKPSRSTGDSLEWKKLFLTKEDEQQFRRVRMCIVQKEETLDTIAERYSINPREIKLHNRLDEESLREGQIIYIP